MTAQSGDLDKFREVARRAGYDRVGDGTWFMRLVTAHIKRHAATITPGHWDEVYPKLDAEGRADAQIKKTMARTSAAGALASVGASTGELLALVTEGLATPIGVPAAAVSMIAEAAYTARLHVDLACDLASIYGAPFDTDDIGEMATLFGLVLEVDVRKKKEEASEEKPKEEAKENEGVTARLMDLEDGELAKRIGRKLLEESILRNVVPVLGIGISARWNWVASRRFGEAARKYARYRRALRHACTKLALGSVEDPALILEGAWLLATIDGEAGHEELLALALILEALPVTSADLRLQDRWDDEEGWFERVAKAPPSVYEALLDVLFLVAATDRAIAPSERRFLRRLSKAIGQDIDQGRLDQFAAHLADGDELPDGFLHCK